jgi:uncharacterized YccA/Bax inhibitor family protein
MALFKSGNPALQEKSFEGTIFEGLADHEVMTINGTLNRFGLLFLVMIGSTIWSWSNFYKGGDPMPFMLTGVFGGLVVALIMGFKKEWSAYLAPVYAILQGLFVGSVSAWYDYAFKTQYPGLVVHAVALTLLVTAVMYALYRFRIIKVTQRFRSVIVIATASIAVFYLAQWVYFAFSGSNFAPFTNAATPLGIGFSVLVVVLAALNLLLNFDSIETGANMRAKKYMEWYCAFGLMVTIVWLYLEILRLLSKLNRD